MNIEGVKELLELGVGLMGEKDMAYCMGVPLPLLRIWLKDRDLEVGAEYLENFRALTFKIQGLRLYQLARNTPMQLKLVESAAPRGDKGAILRFVKRNPGVTAGGVNQRMSPVQGLVQVKELLSQLEVEGWVRKEGYIYYAADA